jgi:hypothetical protein
MGSYSSGPPAPPPPLVSIESLGVEDLMRNPFVKELHRAMMDANQRMVRDSDIQQNLREENARLKTELANLPMMGPPRCAIRPLTLLHLLMCLR